MGIVQSIYTPTRRLANTLKRWRTHIGAALLGGDYTVSPDGVIVFDDLKLRGHFFTGDRENVLGEVLGANLAVNQGIMKALGVMFHTDTKIPGWYLTMFSGSAAPTASLTAANFAATMGEITSTSEGFSNATRPQWNAGAPVANTISNYDDEAVFNVVATTSITATGGALLSSDVRGGTSGVLWAASLWDNPREIFNGEPFGLGYQTSLTD